MRPALISALVLGAIACSTEPRTQVMLVLDADPVVRASAARLQVVVEGGASASNLDTRTETRFGGAGSAPSWPETLALIPRDEDASRAYRAEATAFDANDAPIARAEVISGYVRQRTLMLPLRLDTSCGLTCGNGTTCREGECIDAHVAPESLPDWTGSPPPIDAGMLVDGGVTDAGSMLDPCDGADNDGDGEIDEGHPTQTYYEDADGDGVGSDTSIEACALPDGYATETGDCNPTDPTIIRCAWSCDDGVCNDPVQLSVYTHLCVLRSSGEVVCLGNNTHGQLGIGSETPLAKAFGAAALTDAAEIRVGVAHTCGRTRDGRVACWGLNNFGQLGDGTFDNRSTPTFISDLTSVERLSVGGHHACVRRSEGGVRCWGRNNFGQLGNGLMNDSPIPVPVSGLPSNVDQLAAGLYHTCALLSTGIVWCWGQNFDGQLGDGTIEDRRAFPIQVPNLDSVVAIAAGAYFTCALRSGGDVWCWGQNSHGQLGDGSFGEERATPSPVADLTDAVHLAAGLQHACAIRASGQTVCWGDNELGAVGDGTTLMRTRFVDVVGLTSAVELAAGYRSTCARDASDNVFCWGYNEYGQLGDGTTEDSLVPVRVVPPAP